MKKTIISIVLAFCLVFAFMLAACNDNENSMSDNGSGNTAPDDGNSTPSESSDILIVYFSATNNTEKIAGYIAEATSGVTFELMPVDPYTSADLNYSDHNSRVYREYENEYLRDIELVSVTVDNWDSYETVFVGYPIWWGIAAWSVNNFIKNNDFTGKTVIPFATSASSGLGQSGALLAQMAGTGNWQEGMRFSSGASRSAVSEWVNTLDLA